MRNVYQEIKDADGLKGYTVRFSKGYEVSLWAKNEADAKRTAEECAYDAGRSDEKVTSVREDADWQLLARAFS
jgi:hypothetical protein